jgi:alpha-beta hydrolase superfamily lysophospholipase
MGAIKKKYTHISSSNGVDRLHVTVWEPENPIAILQISHGMIEMMERYDEFARYLAERGFVVAGNDHIGHGRTAAKEADLGYMNAYDASKTMAADLHRVTRALKKAYPRIPFYLMGHSMGSFIARRYMAEYGYDDKYLSMYTPDSSVDGFICMGTGSMPEPVLTFGKGVVASEKMLHGEKYRSKLVDGLTFGLYNRKIPRKTKVNGETRKRTVKDWISTVPEAVDEYMSNPLCSYTFTLKGYDTLYDTLHFAQQKKNLENIPKNIPVLFVAGDKDPVGHYGKDVKKLHKLYEKNVTDDVTGLLYHDCRHEVIHEFCKDKVFEDIYQWLCGAMEKIGEPEGIYQTHNGKAAEKLSNVYQDRVDVAKSLFGILPTDMTLEETREERVTEVEN